jgi:enterochelin esterase-like enzyme
MKLNVAIVSSLLVLAAGAQPPAAPPQTAPGQAAQAPGRGMMGGGRGPALRSPEILDDQKVTFRLRAPNATDVTVNGDWPQGRGVKMTKDEAGVWSATVGPLTPELWAYTFSVDGVSLLDSANSNILRDGTRYSNFVIVDGALSDTYQIKDVPHGNVSLVWYDSPTLPGASPRRMYVYTPPGYDKTSDKYPVFYLLHGAGGDEDAWNNMGRASVIMDNLIAAKKAKPMLVVMTNGNANQKMAPGYGNIPGQVVRSTGNPGEVGVVGAFAGGRGAAPGAPAGAPPAPATPQAQATPGAPAAAGAAANAGRGGNMFGGAFPESLVNDVVPYIEKHYRAIAHKDSRAIAGLSMGGGHTLSATNAHPEVFSYIGVFSMGTMADVSDKLAAIKKAGVKYYYVGHGKDDPVVRVAQGQNLAAQLEKAGINYHYTESTGAHTWANWRIYLNEFAPALFR